MIGRRRDQVPGEIAEALGLTKADRVLAWALRVGGGAVVATTTDFAIVNRQGGVLRKEWVDVERAAWDPTSATLAVWWVGRRQPLGLELAGNSRVPDVVNERVKSSIAMVREVALPGGAVGLVVLRQGGRSGLITQFPFVRGVDQTEPAVRERLERVGRELLADAGS